MNVGHRALCAGADGDHFGDVTEMVSLGLAGLLAGEPSLIHHLHKIAPILVIQQGREMAGRPEFLARFAQEALPVGELVAGRTLAFGRCVDFLAGQCGTRLDARFEDDARFDVHLRRQRWEVVVGLARVERHKSKNIRHIDTFLECVDCIAISDRRVDKARETRHVRHAAFRRKNGRFRRRAHFCACLARPARFELTPLPSEGS